MPSAKCQFCALNTFRENMWTNRQTNKQTNKQDKNNIVTGGTGDYKYYNNDRCSTNLNIYSTLHLCHICNVTLVCYRPLWSSG